MTASIGLQFMVVLAAIWMGARSSGMGLGLWGAVGLTVLIGAFGITPTSPPIDVMLIILAVIMAASVMEAAGGIDFLVGVAERIIRANPKYVTIVAPLTTWTFTFLAGTGHIVYPLLPVIYETAHRSGIRPERPMAVATIASQQAITASPVAAATAAMIGLFAEKGLTPAIVSMFIGKDLKDDKVYQARLAAGEIPAPQAPSARPVLKPAAKLSAFVFLCGVALVVLFGFFPELRKLPGAKSPLSMPIVIEILMMSVAAIMLLVTKVPVDEVPKTATLRAGVVAVIGIFGLAWLGDSFISANKDLIIPAIGEWAKVAPWTFAFGLFFASVLLYSQAATTRALMPLGVVLGIPPQFLIGMFPAVNGYFFIPTYGSLIAAINFDLSGTTKIGRYVLNHSFMIPGLVATAVSVASGLAIANLIV
ncbi:MAG: anaerobic C4-dicarboxylate transporter DcuA [Comamonadaceae bacterium]|nr:MAG: anaerobic C4-dicarboxylate transporter DcuA [Comamonadaceae bacterium]